MSLSCQPYQFFPTLYTVCTMYIWYCTINQQFNRFVIKMELTLSRISHFAGCCLIGLSEIAQWRFRNKIAKSSRRMRSLLNNEKCKLYIRDLCAITILSFDRKNRHNCIHISIRCLLGRARTDFKKSQQTERRPSPDILDDTIIYWKRYLWEILRGLTLGFCRKYFQGMS